MSQQAHPIRIPATLDITTYIGLAAMSLLGISGLPTLNLQLLALALCSLFVLLYRFYFQTERYRQNPNLYFGAQTLVLAFAFLLGSNTTDAFNFLFLLLAIHTALVLPGKTAVLWIATYYVFVSGVIFATRGLDGLYAALFYLIAYFVCGYFGNTLRRAELARDHNEKLIVELQAAQRKLQELAIVEERNRLARDLHDSVKQQVFAISMQLGAARASLGKGDPAYWPVVEAERLAKQAGVELTDLIRELRPAELGEKPLTDALKTTVEDWSRQNRIPVEFTVGGSPPDTFPEDETFFRVAQEALANIARHSQATQVSVSLAIAAETITLTILDNGQGFDPTRVQKGVGLDSMRERLEAVGGQLEIASQNTVGTTITAKVRKST